MTKRPSKESKQRNVIKRDDDEASSHDAPRANDERPTHREDFNRLLNAAVRKRAPED